MITRMSGERFEAIANDLRRERRNGASMFQLKKILRARYGIGTDESGVWEMLTLTASNYDWSNRDPGKRSGKTGEPRTGRRKLTWYMYNATR
jgi:hypothetical protein